MPSSASKLHTQPFITKLPTRRSSDLDCEESILAGAGRQPRVTQGLLRNSLWTLRSLLSSLFILPDSSVPSLPPLTNKVANLRWRLVLHINTDTGPQEVEEQIYPRVSSAIPRLVFDRVVEDETLPFAPGTRLWSDAHTALDLSFAAASRATPVTRLNVLRSSIQRRCRRLRSRRSLRTH